MRVAQPTYTRYIYIYIRLISLRFIIIIIILIEKKYLSIYLFIHILVEFLRGVDRIDNDRPFNVDEMSMMQNFRLRFVSRDDRPSVFARNNIIALALLTLTRVVFSRNDFPRERNAS